LGAFSTRKGGGEKTLGNKRGLSQRGIGEKGKLLLISSKGGRSPGLFGRWEKNSKKKGGKSLKGFL